MAHIAKYKATSVGHMLAHYRRDASSMERDNIDPKRVENDMVVGHYTNKDGRLVVGRVVPREGEPNWGTVERRIERVNEAQKAAGKRATRKDAVVMADVVVTLPDNVRKGDEDRFFRLTYWYLSNKFGIDNMMGGFVHKDEVLKDGTPARDHMHVPFTPILDGRFNYKKAGELTERGAFKAPLSCRRPCYNLGQSFECANTRSSHINRGSSSAIHQHYIKLGYPQTATSQTGRFFHGNEWKRGRFCIPAEPGCEIRLLSNSRISTTYGGSPHLLECIQNRIWGNVLNRYGSPEAVVHQRQGRVVEHTCPDLRLRQHERVDEQDSPRRMV